MKKYLIPLALTVVHLTQASASEVMNPGNLQFEGTVEGGTCSLIADDVERPITLPEVKVSDFAHADSAGHKPFELSARCDSDINSVTFTFHGTPLPSDGARFANTGDGCTRGSAACNGPSAPTAATMPAPWPPAKAWRYCLWGRPTGKPVRSTKERCKAWRQWTSPTTETGVGRQPLQVDGECQSRKPPEPQRLEK